MTHLRTITTRRGSAPTASDIAAHLANRPSLEADVLQILAEKYDYEQHRPCALCGDTGTVVSPVGGGYIATDCPSCCAPQVVEADEEVTP